MARPYALALVLTGFLTVTCAGGALAADKINLDDAIKQALEKNSTILPATLDLETARMDLQKSEADQALTPNPSQLRQRRLAEADAEANLTNTQNKVRREVADQAFSLLRSQDTVALNQRKLAQAQDDLKTIQLKVGLNLESNVSLLTAQKSVLSAEKALNDSQTSLAIARMSFLQYVGADDITADFDLEVSDFELKLDTWDEAKVLEQALANTAKVVNAREQLEGAQLDLKLNDAGFTASTDHRKYEIAVQKAERTLAEEQKTARIQVKQYISDLASLQKDLASAELSVKIADEQLAAAKAKYDQGMITASSLASQEDALTQSKMSLLDTKFKIRDKQQEFHDYLGA